MFDLGSVLQLLYSAAILAKSSGGNTTYISRRTSFVRMFKPPPQKTVDVALLLRGFFVPLLTQLYWHFFVM